MDTNNATSTQERFKRGAADAGGFFRYMADFIGFKPADAETIRQTRFVIEKHIPNIVGDFYSQLLSFPATRSLFAKANGEIDREYLQMRMQHQVGFWRRTAAGEFNDDYARFVDYVGRAHTSHGADPNIYIAERYVIGMVSFVGQRIREALAAELLMLDPDLERRGLDAWNKLLMVLLELLARPYGQSREAVAMEPRLDVNPATMRELAIETYERGLGMARRIEHDEVRVGRIEDIPEGQRVIVQAGEMSVGVFHQGGKWVALHNSCLHRGGPVCEGDLTDGTLTCPWHGYQYELATGQLLLDRSAALPMFPVLVKQGEVFVRVPRYVRDEAPVSLENLFATPSPQTTPAATTAEPTAPLAANEFSPSKLQTGQMTRVMLGKTAIAVYNVGGSYYATEDACTHVGGPLSEGKLDGDTVICPWHASCFDVTNGQVLQGPAKKPLRCYQVTASGDVGRVAL
jgi:nitrite reductase/ring-hydroxylating ferredoxin subunit/hemoglobin-like flavoprotein